MGIEVSKFFFTKKKSCYPQGLKTDEKRWETSFIATFSSHVQCIEFLETILPLHVMYVYNYFYLVDYCYLNCIIIMIIQIRKEVGRH